MDILLSADGDLYLTETGDISLVESVAQKIKIRLRWWLGEWRWDEEEGMPYRDELFIKNPGIRTVSRWLSEKRYLKLTK